MKSSMLLSAVKGLRSAASRLWSRGTTLTVDDLARMCKGAEFQKVFLFEGRDIFAIDFIDPVAGYRLVSVRPSRGSQHVSFSVTSAAVFWGGVIPEEVPHILLSRNQVAQPYSWESYESDSTARLSLSRTVPMAGLDDTVFRTVCEGLCREALALDTQLREKGII